MYVLFEMSGSNRTTSSCLNRETVLVNYCTRTGTNLFVNWGYLIP